MSSTHKNSKIILDALKAATTEADRFRGATAPNPAVGAAALDIHGKLLGVAAHQKAGTAHAEARLLETAATEGWADQIHTLVVTLEPCNHTGKTGPCSEAILKFPSIKKVYFAVSDPNPQAQGGAQKLRSAGLEVVNLSQFKPKSEEVEDARDLTRPFFHHLDSGLPWVTLKTAWRREEGSNQPLTMIPPSGKKTFTSPKSLELAHQLRKRADAIITGSGTILMDNPQFTVRQVPDHPGKTRWLGILDRRGRVPESYLKARQLAGFQTRVSEDLQSLLVFLGAQGVLEVLIEAGPSLSQFVIRNKLFNEHWIITQAEAGGSKDREDEIQRVLCLPELSKN